MLKCAKHSDRDAIGICRSCGTGVCPQCQQQLGGTLFCLACLDAGRYRPAMAIEQPNSGFHSAPSGYISPLTRHVFTIGIIAMAMLIAAFYLLFYYPYLSMMPYASIHPLRTIALALIAISFTLTGFTFLGYSQYFDSKFAKGVAFFSFIAGWLNVYAELLLYTGQVYTGGYYPWDLTPGLLFPHFQFAYVLGQILWGLIFLLWAVILIHTRRFITTQTLVLLASLFFIFIAHVILFMVPFLLTGVMYSPYIMALFYTGYQTFIMVILIEPAALLSAICFYNLRK